MKKILILLTAATLVGAIQGIAMGQQEKTDANTQTTEVTVYYAVVIGDGTIEGAAKVLSIGPEHRTKAEADADAKKWNSDHPKSLRLTDVREKTIKTTVGKFMDAKEAIDKLKEAKEAVDKAKEIVKEGLTAEERKLGDTLKEFTNRIKDSYQNAVNAKKTVTSIVGTIARKQFTDANKLIDSYNRTRTEFSQQSRAAAGSSLLPRFTSTLTQYPEFDQIRPRDLKGKLEGDAPSGKYQVWVYKQVGGRWEKQEERTLGTDDEQQARKYGDDVKAVRGWTATSNLPQRLSEANLVGRRGRGTFMDGVTPFTVEFQAGGVGQFSTADESFPGTWSVQGDSVTLKAGASIMTGTLNGNRMSGRVSRTNASSYVAQERLADRGGPWELTLDP